MERLIITGGSGFIGGNLALVAARTRSVTATYATRHPEVSTRQPELGIDWVRLDITDADAVKRSFDESRPDRVIHLAAISNIDTCERDHELADAVNVSGTRNVAEAAAAVGARLVSISTDNVFDGKSGGYTEDDAPNPINYYGRTKAMGEQIVVASSPTALAVRIPLTLGFPLGGGSSHMKGIFDGIRAGKRPWFLSEEWRSPIDVLTLSDALLELADGPEAGLLHVAGVERVSRSDMGMAWLRRLGLPLDRADWMTKRNDGAIRPADISLDVGRASRVLGTALPDLEKCNERIWRNTNASDTAL
jgi:dTDP-4-dehydrorhamnose reductase